MADITITAGNVVPDSGYGYVDRIAGATITAGQVLYKDTTDSDKAKLADCDASLATATVEGIALNNASSGQPVRVQTSGNITIGGTVVVGEIYVLSGTAGGVAPEADLASNDYVSVLGVGITAAKIQLRIHNSGVQVP